jgi:hypothetical protein
MAECCWGCRKPLPTRGWVACVCEAPYCSAACKTRDTNRHASECAERVSLSATWARRGGAARLGHGGTFGGVEGATFSAQAGKLIQERMPSALLEATLYGLSIIKCVVIVDFRDGEREVRAVPAEAWVEAEAGGENSDDRHTRSVISRNQRELAVTTMCYSGESALLKTLPVVAGRPPTYWLDTQRQVAAHYQATVAWYREKARTEVERDLLLNAIRLQGTVLGPAAIAAARSNIEQRVAAAATTTATTGATKPGMVAEPGMGKNAEKNRKKREKQKSKAALLRGQAAGEAATSAAASPAAMSEPAAAAAHVHSTGYPKEEYVMMLHAAAVGAHEEATAREKQLEALMLGAVQRGDAGTPVVEAAVRNARQAYEVSKATAESLLAEAAAAAKEAVAWEQAQEANAKPADTTPKPKAGKAGVKAGEEQRMSSRGIPSESQGSVLAEYLY